MEEKKTKKRSRGNGEGTIYYDEKNKRWISQYSFKKSDDKKRKTFYGKTRKIAKDKLENFIAELKEKPKSNIPTKKITAFTVEEQKQLFDILKAMLNNAKVLQCQNIMQI